MDSHLYGGINVGMGNFTDLRDWEFKLVNSFLALIYAQVPRGEVCDR